MATVSIVGLIANLMSLVVLVRPKIRETSFNQLLAVVCIVDMLFLTCNSLACFQALGIQLTRKLAFLISQKEIGFAFDV